MLFGEKNIQKHQNILKKKKIFSKKESMGEGERRAVLKETYTNFLKISSDVT